MLSRPCWPGGLRLPTACLPRLPLRCWQSTPTATPGLHRFEEHTRPRDPQTGAPLPHTAASLAEAVRQRRAVVEKRTACSLGGLPQADNAAGALLGGVLASAHGVCCENVVGFVPLPVGVVGPLRVDGSDHHVPLATAEGALVASTSRGAKAVTAAGGTRTALGPSGHRMTRAPLVETPDVPTAAQLCAWLESDEGFAAVDAAVRSSSRHTRLREIRTHQAGRFVWLRMALSTGDAMGMNMATLAATRVLAMLEHPQARVKGVRAVSVSGNVCADKKPAAINALCGRGRRVSAEVRLPAAVLERILHCRDPRTLERLCALKCWLGSGVAGALPGGLNAHASNVVAAVFAATGQDLAQVVVSSNCVTVMEAQRERGSDVLVASCTMPSLELGTIGGGTRLGPQSTCIDLMTRRLNRSSSSNSNNKKQQEFEKEGDKGDLMARVLCSTVLAAELSLMAALARGDLAASHLRLNRKK